MGVIAPGDMLVRTKRRGSPHVWSKHDESGFSKEIHENLVMGKLILIISVFCKTYDWSSHGQTCTYLVLFDGRLAWMQASSTDIELSHQRV